MGSEWIELVWGVRDENLPEEVPEGYESWQAWFECVRDRPVAKQFCRPSDFNKKRNSFTDPYVECIGLVSHIFELPIEMSLNELARMAQIEKDMWNSFRKWVSEVYEIELPEGEPIILVLRD